MKANKQLLIDRIQIPGDNRLRGLFGDLRNVSQLTDKMIEDFLNTNFSKIFQQ